MRKLKKGLRFSKESRQELAEHMVDVEYRDCVQNSKQTTRDMAEEIFDLIDDYYGVPDMISAIETTIGAIAYDEVIAMSHTFPYSFTDSKGQQRLIVFAIGSPRYVPFLLGCYATDFTENFMNIVAPEFRAKVESVAERHLNLMDELNAIKGRVYDWLCQFPSPKALLEKYPHVEPYMPADYFEDEPLTVQLDNLLEIINNEEAA